MNKSVHVIQSLHNFTGFYPVPTQHFRQNSTLPVYSKKTATCTPTPSHVNLLAGSISVREPSGSGPGPPLRIPLNPCSCLCPIKHNPPHCVSVSGSNAGYLPTFPRKALLFLPLSKKSTSSTTCTASLPGVSRRGTHHLISDEVYESWENQEVAMRREKGVLLDERGYLKEVKPAMPGDVARDERGRGWSPLAPVSLQG